MSVEDIIERLRGLDLEIGVVQDEADQSRPVVLIRLPLPGPPGPAAAPECPGEPEPEAAEVPAPAKGELADPTDYGFNDILVDIARRQRALRSRVGRAAPAARVLRAWQYGRSAAQLLRGARRFDISLPAVSPALLTTVLPP